MRLFLLTTAVVIATLSTAAFAEDPAKMVYELRIYTTIPGRLDALNARFRDHTVAIFKKHGMTNVAYFTPIEEKDGKSTKLIYFLAFPSREAHDKSFAEFRADPEWVKVKAEYEKNGSLTIAPPDGVVDILLTPTDYSPLR